MNTVITNTPRAGETGEQTAARSAPRSRELLAERHQTHGTFEDNANISQALKETMHRTPGWNSLSTIEREAMDMIALKFSRILSGKSMQQQHWEDVAGYARLVELKCIP